MKRVKVAAMTPVGKRAGRFWSRLRRQLVSCFLLCLLVLAAAAGCVHKTLKGSDAPIFLIVNWPGTNPPELSLKERARNYQAWVESRYQMPDGLIRYRRWLTGQEMPGYGNLADGCFQLGIYLASQALRFAATGDPDAREQVMLSLGAMKLYAEVSGVRGLLARYFSPVKPDDDRWHHSQTHPQYFWRSDVSRDQYAGHIHGLGVTLAVVSDPEIRSQIATLAAPIADHLMENGLKIIDWDGQPTTHGDLRGRIIGSIPNGVNALICLVIFKVAGESTGEQKYIDFYEQLVQDGYLRITYWTKISIFGTGRVNANMAYLALYPLLLLEDDQEVVRELRAGAQRIWPRVREDHNSFFSFVHAAVVGDAEEGKVRGREAILEFPDRKLFWVTRKSEPTSAEAAVPLYLRPRTASLWVSDPTIAAHLETVGHGGYAGIDYLIAYWLGRYHGFIGSDE